MEVRTEQLSTNGSLGYSREHKDVGEDVMEISTFSQFIVQVDLELWGKIHGNTSENYLCIAKAQCYKQIKATNSI